MAQNEAVKKRESRQGGQKDGKIVCRSFKVEKFPFFFIVSVPFFYNLCIDFSSCSKTKVSLKKLSSLDFNSQDYVHKLFFF